MNNTLREFNNIQSSIDSTYHEAAMKLGNTDTEMIILYILTLEGDGCNQSVIYQKSGITKSTVNTALHKMEQKSLVTLKSGKGRNIRVFLTDEGKRVADDTAGKIIDMENEIFDSWSVEEREIFLKLNQRFLEEMRKKVKEL